MSRDRDPKAETHNPACGFSGPALPWNGRVEPGPSPVRMKDAPKMTYAGTTLSMRRRDALRRCAGERILRSAPAVSPDAKPGSTSPFTAMARTLSGADTSSLL